MNEQKIERDDDDDELNCEEKYISINNSVKITNKILEESYKFKQISEINKIKNDSCCYKYFLKDSNSDNGWGECFWFYYWYFFWKNNN